MNRAFYLTIAMLGTVLFYGSVTSSEPVKPAAAQQPIDIQQLTWLQGSWTRSEGQRRMEEYWTNPAGKTMLGVARTVVGDRTVEFEYLRIVQTDPDKIVYYASPAGRCPATPFELTQIEGERAVFENLSHDFPQRIIYWRDAGRTLHARIEGVSGDRQRHMEWSWPPQK